VRDFCKAVATVTISDVNIEVTFSNLFVYNLLKKTGTLYSYVYTSFYGQ